MHARPRQRGWSRPSPPRLRCWPRGNPWKPGASSVRSCCRVNLAEPPLAAGFALAAGTPETPPVFRGCPRAGQLTLPHPSHHRLGLERGGRLVLAIAPGTALARLVFPSSAGSADHGLILVERGAKPKSQALSMGRHGL